MAGMQLPQWLARANRRITNPVQRMWAGWAPSYGILEHVGRRSGKHYRTPLMVFNTAEGVAIMLTYGPDRDWLKNLTAAGSATMRRHGATFTVSEPRVVSRSQAAAQVVGGMRQVFSRLPFDSAVLLRRN